MHVEMTGYARSGGLTEIHADVHTVRRIRGLQRDHGITNADPQLGVLRDCQLLERGDLAIGHHHQVTAPVGIGVEDRKALRSAPHDVRLVVGQAGAEDLRED